MNQTIFNIVSVVVYIFLAVIWRTHSTVNQLVKFVLAIMAVYGILICLKDLGYIIQF